MSIAVHPDVRDALAAGKQVVALETAVLTHGLPREPLAEPPDLSSIGILQQWRPNEPANLETMRLMIDIVRSGGAVAAVTAVIEGTLQVGLTDDQIIRLARQEGTGKASAANLATFVAKRQSAGTTVSATLAACALAQPSPLRVLATGGIGGVHRKWSEALDISADLFELARTPVAVICSGAKSILDVPATLGMLEALGVLVIGYGTDKLPRFFSRGGSDPVHARAESPHEVAELCRAHWNDLQRRQAVLIVQPPPADFALTGSESESTIDAAENEAQKRGIFGPDRTPFLLQHVAELTDGRSLRANIVLLADNARLAAAVAAAWAESH